MERIGKRMGCVVFLLARILGYGILVWWVGIMGYSHITRVPSISYDIMRGLGRYVERYGAYPEAGTLADITREEKDMFKELPSPLMFAELDSDGRGIYTWLSESLASDVLRICYSPPLGDPAESPPYSGGTVQITGLDKVEEMENESVRRWAFGIMCGIDLVACWVIVNLVRCYRPSLARRLAGVNGECPREQKSD